MLLLCAIIASQRLDGRDPIEDEPTYGAKIAPKRNPYRQPNKALIRQILGMVSRKEWSRLIPLCDQEVLISLSEQDYPQGGERTQAPARNYRSEASLVRRKALPTVSPEFLREFHELVEYSLNPENNCVDCIGYREAEAYRELPSIGSGILGHTGSNGTWRIGLVYANKEGRGTWLITSLEMGFH